MTLVRLGRGVQPDFREGDEAVDIDLFRAIGGADALGPGAIAAEEGAELLAAVAEDFVEESGEGFEVFEGEFGVLGSGESDDGGIDFGGWVEAAGGDFADEVCFETDLEEDAEDTVGFGAGSGEDTVGDLFLDEGDGVGHSGHLGGEVDQER